jgi:hypothetical protein
MHPRPVTGRWPAAAYICLMVALVVAEPAIVSLTVHDHVQLDRLTSASAERYGDLIPPGTTPVRLAAGTYVFRTTADAQVQLNRGAAVEVTAIQAPANKGDWPDLAAAHFSLQAAYMRIVTGRGPGRRVAASSR